MGSIIQPILVEQLVSSTIPELQDAHDFLSLNGGEAMQQVAGLKNVAVWGQSVKRVGHPEFIEHLLHHVLIKAMEGRLDARILFTEGPVPIQKTIRSRYGVEAATARAREYG